MGARITGRKRRKLRIRKKVKGVPERPRLSVFRSARHIYAQVVDDVRRQTLLSASSLVKEYADEPEPEVGKGEKAPSTKIAGARKVGAMVARRCQEMGIQKVVFDRNGYLYHGRVQALAEAARKAGLDL